MRTRKVIVLPYDKTWAADFEKIRQELGWDVYAPYYTDVFDLVSGQQVYVAPKTVRAKPRTQTGVSKIYTALLI